MVTLYSDFDGLPYPRARGEASYFFFLLLYFSSFCKMTAKDNRRGMQRGGTSPKLTGKFKSTVIGKIRKEGAGKRREKTRSYQNLKAIRASIKAEDPASCRVLSTRPGV